MLTPSSSHIGPMKRSLMELGAAIPLVRNKEKRNAQGIRAIAGKAPSHGIGLLYGKLKRDK